MDENALEVFQHFQENSNVVIFPFSFSHLHAVGQLVIHPPLRILFHPKDMKLS